MNRRAGGLACKCSGYKWSMRTYKILKRLLILALAVTAGTTRAQPQLDSGSHTSLAEIRKQVLAWSKEDDQRLAGEDYLSSRFGQIRKLIRSEILRQLNAGFASPNELSERLRPVIQDEGETHTSMLAWQGNAGQVVVVGY